MHTLRHFGHCGLYDWESVMCDGRLLWLLCCYCRYRMGFALYGPSLPHRSSDLLLPVCSLLRFSYRTRGRAFLIEQGCLHDHSGDDVWVHVGGRAAVLILIVPTLLLLSSARDANRGTSVGNAVLERVDTTRFMLAGKAALVALAVSKNLSSPYPIFRSVR